MYKRILVATDGHTLSKKAVKAALGMAELTGAELVAINVVHRYPMVYSEAGIMTGNDEINKIEAHWVKEAQKIVGAVKEAGSKQGTFVKAVTVKSDMVAEALIAAASKYKCDLIVMASHGRKGLKRILLGSETQHVLTHSTVPVLVLR